MTVNRGHSSTSGATYRSHAITQRRERNLRLTLDAKLGDATSFENLASPQRKRKETYKSVAKILKGPDPFSTIESHHRIFCKLGDT